MKSNSIVKNQGGVVVVPKPKPETKPETKPEPTQSGSGVSSSSGTASGFSVGNSSGTTTSGGADPQGGTAFQQLQNIAGGGSFYTPTPSPVNKGLSQSQDKSGIPDGYYVAYEDENNYYCYPLLTNDQRAEIISKLEVQLPTDPGAKIRREAIRLAKCMVSKNAQYKEGATINEFLADCEAAAAQPTDCSSLVQWVTDSAACTVGGFCMAAGRKEYFKALRTGSEQYKMFQKNNAITWTPKGGDVLFLKKISGSTKPIDHVGIFLMRKGTSIWIIHASANPKTSKVMVAEYPAEEGWGMKIMGYGNLEALLR
jgi:hypothetical protein